MSPQSITSASLSTGSNPIQVGAQGLILEISLTNSGKPMNLALSTVRKITIKTPSGEKIQRDAILSSNGTDGKIKYLTQADDLKLAGTYQVQVFIATPDFSSYSSISSFNVSSNL
jgi:hypothetical protein